MLALTMLSCFIWLVMIFARGMFWREKPLPWPEPRYTTPDIVVIIPARDEAAVIERSVTSLIRQDYTGPYKIVLIDDHSSDGTAEKARAISQKMGQAARLIIIPAPALPQGWGGKLWAMQTGLDVVKTIMPKADYVLFTDADIEHGQASLRELVTRAEAGGFALTSFMVKLHCQTWAEKVFIPAFVFFFQMLYPFAFARDPSNKLAAAAGGAMLVRRHALDALGGLKILRDALIDDCALAAHMKKQGPIWLGLTDEVKSLRAYEKTSDLWAMITRSAYAQLNYSPLLLILCVMGMAVTFLVPVYMAFHASMAPLGLFMWALMALAYMPTLRFYGLSPLWAPLLPFIAFVYMLATLDSARRFMTGKGGLWKGRVRSAAV